MKLSNAVRDEIERFLEMEHSNPGHYRRFVLVCTGLSNHLKTLVRSLQRVREPWSSYGNALPLTDQSYQDFQRIVIRYKQPQEMADFIFQKVDVEWEWQAGKAGEATPFREELLRAFPSYEDLPSREIRTAWEQLHALLRARCNIPILRAELEARLPRLTNSDPPIRLHTLGSSVDAVDPGALLLDWRTFFSSEGRSYPAPCAWTQEVVEGLRDTREWIGTHRSARRIQLAGSRRLSAVIAIGAVFSAVAGFNIEMHYRGATWATDAHPDDGTPPFDLSHSITRLSSKTLVVSIGILRDIAVEAETYLKRTELSNSSILHLHSTTALVSPAHANRAASALKQAISEEVVSTGAGDIHLFYAGPSPLALFLAHRLNATARIQCYEWVQAGEYVPTCRL